MKKNCKDILHSQLKLLIGFPTFEFFLGASKAPGQRILRSLRKNGKSSEEATRRIKTANYGRQGSPPCSQPSVKFSPEPVLLITLLEDGILPS
jgi:hypothetical protein